MSTLLKKFLIHPILIMRSLHLVQLKTSSRVLELQLLLGLVRQEGLTTVAIILLPMPLCLASGKMAIVHD